MKIHAPLAFAILCLSTGPVLAASSTASADDQWKLVFEDDFGDTGSPLADWITFGDASSSDAGERGRGLRLHAVGGQQPPAYAGAVTPLGGGIKVDEIVTVRLRWRADGRSPGDAKLALKLECKNRIADETGVLETLIPIAGTDGWAEAVVEGAIPGGTAAVQFAVVLVPSSGPESAGVVIDEVTAHRRAAPVDLLQGRGTWETNDGGASGWSAFNNAIAVNDPVNGRVLKTWGPFNEPYGGSGATMTVPLPTTDRPSRLEASVEAFTAPDDSIASTDNFPVLRIECLDADGQPLAHTEARPFDPGAAEVPVGRWSESTAALDVPAAATQVKYILAFIQPTTKGGSVLFRNARLQAAGGDGAELLPNPTFEGGDGLPGWTVAGENADGIARDDRTPRTGAAALRLPARTDRVEATTTIANILPGERLRFDGHMQVPERDAPDSSRPLVEVEVVQRDRLGEPVARRTIRAIAGGAGEWTAIARDDSDATIEVADGADRLDLILRGPGGDQGSVLVDDLAVRRIGDASAEGDAIPVRNPGFAGGRPDDAWWNVADGAWSHNGELQYYAPDRAVVRNGVLGLTADRRPVGDRGLSSAHISTEGRKRLTYGRWEIRAKLPSSQGMWPAIWLLPTDGSWPPEIDIIELVGKEPDRVHHSFHWGPLRDGLLPWDLGQTSTTHTRRRDFSDTWHDFGLEWTPEAIIWFVDGKETHRFGRTPEERSRIPNTPMYLIMNLAVGGFWPGPPGEDTIWPSTMEIDRVRVWSWEGDGRKR